MQPGMLYPGCHGVSSLLSNLELHRPMSLLLHDRRTAGTVLPVSFRNRFLGWWSGMRHSADFFECGFVQGSLRLGKHSPHHRFEEL
jgi:hypothetical protein